VKKGAGVQGFARRITGLIYEFSQQLGQLAGLDSVQFAVLMQAHFNQGLADPLIHPFKKTKARSSACRALFGGFLAK